MNPQQALDVLAQAAAQFRGVLEDHQNLQNALITLKPLVDAAMAAAEPAETPDGQ